MQDFSSEVPGRCSFLVGQAGMGTSAQVATVNRVIITSIWVPWDCIVDEIIARCQTPSPGNSWRVGLYADSGNPTTPLGGPLLFDSGDIPAAVGPLRGTPPGGGVYVKRGVVWFALAAQDAVMAFLRNNATTVTPPTSLISMLDGCLYTLGAWGALTNPCPAVTKTAAAKFTCMVHVKNYWSK